MIRYISNANARQSLSVNTSVKVMENLFKEGLSHITAIDRQLIPLDKKSGLTLFMPAQDPKNELLGIKISSIRPENSKIPQINGLYVLIDYATGTPKAVIDGNAITKLRTAAVTALVTELMVGKEGCKSLGIIGAGVQAFAHAEAICQVCEVDELYVYSRSLETVEKFTEKVKLSSWSPSYVKSASSIKYVLDHSAVLCTCTSTASTTPLVYRRDLPLTLRHINAIGGGTLEALEIDPFLYSDSLIIVESAREASNESGEMKVALENGFINTDRLKTISDLIRLKAVGKLDNTCLSIYRSVGLSIEDLFLANEIFKASEDMGFGINISV